MAADAGIWLTPGSLFDIGGKDLPWLRFNVAYSQDPELWRFLREAGRRAGRSAGIASLAALIHDACS